MAQMDILMNPVRIRILQYLSIYGESTAGDMIAEITEVSKASVYNHLKILEENHMIQVVSENHIRGTVEKLYCISKDSESSSFHAIVSFLLLLMADFQKYYDKHNTPKADMLFAGRDYLMLTDEEYRSFMDEYAALCAKYYKKDSAGSKLRCLSIISAPVDEDYKNE